MPEQVMITKRICDLQVGDRFMFVNIACKVTKINNRIHYHYVSNASGRYSFGLKCQAAVEMLPALPAKEKDEIPPDVILKKKSVGQTHSIKLGKIRKRTYD